LSILRPIAFAFTGTSLTTGRLACPDISWVPRLMRELRQQPECKGEVIVWNMGKGSQTSDWGRTNAPELSNLRPSHILFEGFGINDCAIGPLTLAQSAANFSAMVAEWRGNIPGVDLTHQTMSPASAGDSSRTQLQAYYDQELSLAASLGIPSLNHTPGWAPITAANTNGAPAGDGLHPLWSVFSLYSYPSILAWAKAKMAAYGPWQ
jgi:hypothetical protein